MKKIYYILIFLYRTFLYKKGVDVMLAEIRGRSQITIPAEIIKKLGITEGDKFEIMEKDGGIFLCPVVVYPKDKIAKIAKIIKESARQIL